MAYQPPLVLTILSAISIGIAALVAIWIMLDIVIRRGWRSMMAVMIPVYVINALYLWPITLWTYLKYGRPEKPSKNDALKDKPSHDHQDLDSGDHEQSHTDHDHSMRHDSGQMAEDSHAHHHHHHHTSDRPMFATVTVAVCHCGAGCVLGDIVGEWLVYGAGITINGQMLWAEFLIDFGFALLFGIFFQYFSIAPMSGEWGLVTLVRAAKADFLSLAFFEVGLFGWMAIFQILIFNWQLEMNHITYWWMMQVGMFLGHWTALPINWWLISKGVKAPCA